MSEHTNSANPKPPSVDRLSLLWRRIKEHKMMQWSVAYVALAYGVQHGVELTSDAFEWPHLVARISMLLLILGLPVVMTFAWYHGEHASRQFTKAELSILSALLVIGSLLFYAFVRPSEQIAAGPNPATQQAGVAAARSASLNVGNAISIAVMPFANVTGDAGRDFFSDGMTDEIAGALAKVPDLRVVARSSAFQFKGKDQEARAIGQALGATHLIEGSVRQAGNRVRITAQLIQAENGLQIWSDNYDRDLTDVFAIQEDIARAITTSLRMPLGLKPGENLVNNRLKDVATYEEFLRAKVMVRGRLAGRGIIDIQSAIELLDRIVAKEPDFAPSWGLLGLAHAYTPLYSPAFFLGNSVEELRRLAENSLPKAEAAAQRAIRLDPKNPDGYTALGMVQMVRGKFLMGSDLLSRAVDLDPTNPDALHLYSDALANLGYIKQALPLRRRLLDLEPYPAPYKAVTTRVLMAAGLLDEAEMMAKSGAGGADPLALARIFAAKGHYGEAADALQPGLRLAPGVPDSVVSLLRAAPKAQASAQSPSFGRLSWVYLYTGAPERVLEFYEGNMKAGYQAPGDDIFLWTQPYAALRKTERFKAYVRKAGMVDYWKAKGWPDLCKPVGADDFVCD